MQYARSASRTSPCVAIARRMRVGVLLAAVASCSVWATDNAPRPLAPVETAHFKPVPARTPAPAPIEGRRAPTPATAAPPPVVAGEREAVLAMFAHDPAAPTPPQNKNPPPVIWSIGLSLGN